MLDRPATPAAALQRAATIGREAGLCHVYLGNLTGVGGEDTLCPHCGETVVSRRGFRVVAMAIDGGCCRACGGKVAGVGMGDTP
jgi:pyruvate formate lyase activating enzyme